MDEKKKKSLLIGLPAAALLIIICIVICLLNSCKACAPADDATTQETVIFSGDDSAIPGFSYTITKSSGQGSNTSQGENSRYSLNFNAAPSTDFSLEGKGYSLEEKTNESGSFSVFDLPAGEYTLTISGKTITIIISEDIDTEETTSKADSSVSKNNSDNSSKPANSSIVAQNSSEVEESSEAPSENNVKIEESGYADEESSEESTDYDNEDYEEDDYDYTAEENDKEENVTSKPSTGTGSGSTSGNTSQAPQHTHSYTIPVYEDVLIKAGYSEQVLVREAWDEQVLVEEAYDEYIYTGKEIVVCYCGATFDTYENYTNHVLSYAVNANDSASIAEYAKHQGYQTLPEYELIHHEAEYKTIHHEAEYETVTHDPVYETQVVGYACSCGAVK